MSAATVASASLYVGDLHPEVTEPMLFEIFSPVGPVASIRVCRDNITRRSLGYAYVNFHNIIDAERALETHNCVPILNKTCRIMWKQRDPSMRKTGVGNVFIKCLDESIDNRTLNDTFSAFGNILSCKVAFDDQGVSKGYGYVQYETQEEADHAIAQVNGMEIKKKIVHVQRFLPRSEREKSNNFLTNIYVKHLDPSVDNEKLKELFSEYGVITSAVVMRKEEGVSKGFGFVYFEKHEMAKEALAQMNGKVIGEQQALYCAWAEKKKKRQQRLQREREQKRVEQSLKYQYINLYVKNLDDSVDEEKLRKAFEPYGTITSAKISTDEKGLSKGFGYVCFSTPEEATKAVTAMNGTMFFTKPLFVALHQNKEARRAQLQAQFAQHQKINMRMPMTGQMPPGMTGMPFMYPPGAGGPVQRPGMFFYPSAVGPTGPQAPRWANNQRMPMAGQRQQRRRQVQQPQPGQPIPQQGGGQGVGQSQQRRGVSGFKYAPNVRNRDQVQPPQAMPVAMNMPMPMGVSGGPGFPDLTAASLASLPPTAQKQLLGEKLFAQISVTHAEQAPKITGMLLELDNSELLHLLVTADALQAKIVEALTALNASAAIPEPQPSGIVSE